jgi:hypothetical protein
MKDQELQLAQMVCVGIVLNVRQLNPYKPAVFFQVKTSTPKVAHCHCVVDKGISRMPNGL